MAGTFSRLLYHLVFSTKHRTRFIDPEVRTELYPYMGGIVHNLGGWLLALGGMPDHVHLLIRLKPDMPVSNLVRDVKANSSKWIHEQKRFPADFAWQTGYAAFTVSESQEGVVRSYIQNQEKHHRRTTFEDELLAMLRKHRIELDPVHVFD